MTMRKHLRIGIIFGLLLLVMPGGFWLLHRRQAFRASPAVGLPTQAADGSVDTRVSDPVKDSLLRAEAVSTFKQKWCRGLICRPLLSAILEDSLYRGAKGYRSTRLAIIRAEYSRVVVSNDFTLNAPGAGISSHSVLAVMDTSGKVVKWLRKD
jgi:hypothetical protein